MSQEIVSIEKSALSIIEKALSNPDIDTQKLHSMLEFQLKVMEKQSEIAYNEAFARLQPKLPAIEKNGAISYEKNGKTTHIPFAKYEDIDAKIRPLLNEEGFSISFDSEETPKGTRYSGTLKHRMGHSETKWSPPLPADTTGSKNAIQAIGSTVSYAKRYLVGMLLNLITKGEDDDGNSTSVITPEQVKEIELLILDTDSKKDLFLKHLGVEKISDLQQKDFNMAVTLLKQKGRQKAK